MQLSTAIITGRQHRLMQQNGHDFAVAGQPAEGCAFGLVLDGCGSRYQQSDSGNQRVSPAQSEVGAKLIGQFTAEWLRSNLVVFSAQGLEKTLAALFDSILQFVAGIIDAMPFAAEDSRHGFVFTHLLATLVGFVVTPAEADFFWIGDGFLCQDGQITHLDCQNQPDYLVHHFYGGHPTRFARRPIEKPAALSWLAVATDGWEPDLLARISPEATTLELQRWVNTRARHRRFFEDDGAIAIWCNKRNDVSRYRRPNEQ